MATMPSEIQDEDAMNKHKNRRLKVTEGLMGLLELLKT